MQITMGTSAAESLSAAGNIFVGQVKGKAVEICIRLEKVDLNSRPRLARTIYCRTFSEIELDT